MEDKDISLGAFILDVIKAHYAQIRMLAAHRGVINSVLNACPKGAVNRIWADNTFNIEASGNREALVQLIRALRINSFKTDKKPKEGEAEYRAFFKNEEGLTIYFSFTSTMCRRVQVGTRQIYEPIYEVQCEDMADVELEGAA